jgi:hypothetical protein
MVNSVLYFHLALGLLLVGMIAARKVPAWRGPAVVAAILVVLTGAFNFMTTMAGAPKLWHALIGVKILLALHVVAITFLMARGGDEAKLARWRKGALISGTLVIALGLYLSNFTR